MKDKLERTVSSRTPTRLWGAVPEGSGTVRRDIVESDPAAQLIGRVLDGRYEVVKVLGRGGMGVVYEAHDRSLDRAVVVKVLAPGSHDRSSGVRLMREAQLACRVEHPSIVTVFQLGMLETGEPYVVMERLVGSDLDDLLRKHGRFDLEETIALLEPLAEALDVLHEESIVHRDLKPENVFVIGGRVARPRVKLIDFGLAMLDEKSYARLTRAGHLLGTAEYIAPELLRGGRPTWACDVYALATLAFELLSGDTPFAGAPIEILGAKTSRDAPPLTDHLEAPWAPAVGRVLAQGLSRDPRQRPRAGQLVDALREIAAAAAPSRAPERAPEAAVERAAPALAAHADGASRLPWAIAITSTIGMLVALAALVVTALS